MASFFQGFFVAATLIIAIGAQNAFVLKQGLIGNKIFPVVSICFLCDFILISVGVLGVGNIINQSLLATLIFSLAGALFLIFYGLKSFMDAYRGTMFLEESDSSERKTFSVILSTLAITLLNPHVYLDTVVVIGGIAGSLSFRQKTGFLIGASLSSLIWFTGLGYGAKFLRRFFRNPKTWQILNTLIGILMWWIAFELLRYAYHSSSSFGYF